MNLGSARKPVAFVLYFLASLGGLLSVLALFMVQENHRINASTGDFAGAGLASLFLLVYILPLTLVALVLALSLAPPFAPKPRPKLAVGLLAAAVALVVVVGMVLASILRTAYQHYDTHGSDLVRLALADLVLFSPLLVLAGVLGLIGGRMRRSGRASTPVCDP